MDDLDQLLLLAGNEDQEGGWNFHFDPIGLNLQIRPKRHRYWCTPLKAKTFAQTGGDGTHYSFLAIPGIRRAERPIVMTVPMMSDDPNVIVGANLREFLALGCRFGYFALEGLVYDPRQTLALLKRGTYLAEATRKEIRMLKLLEKTFCLQPWFKPKKRLAELRLQYFPHVKLSRRTAF